jgi:hypothetical protein
MKEGFFFVLKRLVFLLLFERLINYFTLRSLLKLGLVMKPAFVTFIHLALFVFFLNILHYFCPGES